MKEDIAHAPRTPRDPRDPLGLNTMIEDSASQESPSPAPRNIDSASGREIVACGYSAWLDPQSPFFMHYFWKSLVDEGSALNYFPAQDASGMPTGYPALVALLSSQDVKAQGIYSRSIEPGAAASIEPIGFAFASPVVHGTVTMLSIRLVLLDAWWGRPAVTEACRGIIAAWFTEGTQSRPWLQHLICTVPAFDTHSPVLLRDLGWTRSGSIPDACLHLGQYHAVDTWYYTRRDFNQYQARKAWPNWQPPDIAADPAQGGN